MEIKIKIPEADEIRAELDSVLCEAKRLKALLKIAEQYESEIEKLKAE